jgi:large conductance mechanosensitive channel
MTNSHGATDRARRISSFDGFKKFLLRGNLVDLAVAVVIGTAFTAVVKALTDSFVTPLIAAVGGRRDFSALFFTLHSSQFKYGLFVSALITFGITAAVVYYFVVLPVGKLLDRYKPEVTPAPATKDCPHCVSKIPAAATVCAFCTRDVGGIDVAKAL